MPYKLVNELGRATLAIFEHIVGLAISRTAMQRYGFFLYLQIFLQLFLHFFKLFFKNGLRGHSEGEKIFTYIRPGGRTDGRKKSRILQPI